MHVITSIAALQRTLAASTSAATSLLGEDRPVVATGLAALDEMLPGGGFAAGAVHEILSGTDVPSFLLPVLIARAAARVGRVVWCDGRSEQTSGHDSKGRPTRRLHPRAVAALGLPLDRLVVLRPPTLADELWAVAECLRCKGISACVAPLSGRLSRLQARRFQLAAERGGGLGLVLRPAGAAAWPYAAATRCLVQPAPGERTVQRWSVQLIHGHGGRLEQPVLLEMCRETYHVRAADAVVHRPPQAQSG